MFGFGKKKQVFLNKSLQSEYEKLSLTKRSNIESEADKVHTVIHYEAHLHGVGSRFFNRIFCLKDGAFETIHGEDRVYDFWGSGEPEIIAASYPIAFKLNTLITTNEMFSELIKQEHVHSARYNSGLSHLSSEIALWVLLERNDFKVNLPKLMKLWKDADS